MSQDNNYSRGPVPLAARKGVIPLTFVMLGLTFFSASMWTGGTLGTGLSYNDFFLAVLFGNLLLGIYTAFLGFIGAKTGLSTHLLARYSFGLKGSWLPSLLLGGTQVGWFGVGVAMFAIPVGKATGIDVNVLIAVSGLLMTLTIFFGISALTVLSIIAVPAIVGSWQLLRLAGGERCWRFRPFKSDSAADTAEFLNRTGAGGRLIYQRRHVNRRLCPLWPQRQRCGTDCHGGIFPWQLVDVYLRRCGCRRCWTGGHL